MTSPLVSASRVSIPLVRAGMTAPPSQLQSTCPQIGQSPSLRFAALVFAEWTMGILEIGYCKACPSELAESNARTLGNICLCTSFFFLLGVGGAWSPSLSGGVLRGSGWSRPSGVAPPVFSPGGGSGCCSRPFSLPPLASPTNLRPPS